MVKRARNKIGQFISISSMAKNQHLPFIKIFHKVLNVLMAIFLLFLVCPWITLAIKSKILKEWANALINACNSHEFNDTNGAYEAKKLQMIFNNLICLFHYF